MTFRDKIKGVKRMKTKIKKILSMLLASLITIGVASALTSPAIITTLGSNTVDWSGQGVTNGLLDNVDCSAGAAGPGTPANTPYLYWVMTYDGNTLNPVQSTLVLGGTGSGTFTMVPASPSLAATTGFFPLSGLTASATFNVVALGSGKVNLVISHGCSGTTTQIPEFPTVALPIAGVIGLVFFFQHRKRKEE
jgi:hypothetical protein